MKKVLTIAEWTEIGNKAKDINRNLNELCTLLSERLNLQDYYNKWKSADKAFDNLRSQLDDIVCDRFPNLPDREITHIFYGTDEKVKS
ncbi:MAG TPA: hypothetical protein VGK10_21265 [Prolixibacteraceae bacterium]|jgi:hypothetical protein